MSVTSLFNDGKVNWNTQQPMSLSSVEEYIKIAERLKPQLEKFIETLEAQTGVKLDASPACLKTTTSAHRKLGDYTVNSDPRNINDYLRASGDITATNKADTIAQTEALIEFAQKSEQVTGFKNQIAFPDAQTGMRSLKLHVRIQDGGDVMDAEFLIGHQGMEKAYEVTKALRSFERGFRAASCADDKTLSGKAKQRASHGTAIAREARHIIHNEAAEKIGWNDLIDPKVRHLHTAKISDINIVGMGKSPMEKIINKFDMV